MSRSNVRMLVLLACGILTVAIAVGSREGVIPDTRPAHPDARLIEDAAGRLQPEACSRIAAYLAYVRASYGIDYRVVVCDALEGVDPERAATDLFAALDVGKATDGRGLLLVVELDARRARVEVGYALESYITDLEASRMITGYLAPYFDNDAEGQGIEASVEALVNNLRPHLVELRHDRLEARGSGGGGATVDLLAGLPEADLSPATRATLERVLVPQDHPAKALNLELAMMHKGIYYRDVALYDPAWRRANRPDHWSPARLKEIAREWDRPFEVLIDEPYAIAYFQDAPAIGPTFFRRTERGWTIDATSVCRNIIYDYSNEAWYALDGDYPYLALLKQVLPMRNVSLTSGRRAWMLID